METLRCIENQEQRKFIARRMVVKIGTTTITGGQSRPDSLFMKEVARQTTELLNDGVEVVIVSSGAVASGKKEGFERRDIADKQVEAVFGQRKLMEQWSRAFEEHGIEDVGQQLYTDIDLHERTASARDVLTRALRRGVVIVNYNDGVSDEEMRKVERATDNDVLAQQVAALINADTLLFLTDTDGVLDENGATISSVDRLEDIQDLIRTGEGSGTGGPWSKWVQAKSAARDGRRAFISHGRGEDTILKIASGRHVGTRFVKGYMLY